MAEVGLEPKFTVNGTQQSPIVITEAETWYTKVDEKFFYSAYSGKPLAGYLDQHNFIFTEFESIKVGKDDWTLRRIHFHDGAEHLIAGRPRSDFEVHLVHTIGTKPEEDPNLLTPKLVIGVLFKIKARATSRPSFHELSKAIGKASRSVDGTLEAIRDVAVDPLHFLPDKEDWPYWFRYEGSLTSGSYSEDVSWFVYRNETDLSSADVEKLKGEAEQTARETYPINRRFILRSFEDLKAAKKGKK
jgi:carbonic anhydrase